VQTLLYLVHRIPYPPNKGDKIRSFHLLKHLSKKYKVILGAFVDDPNDWQYKEHLSEYCEEVFLLPLNSLWSKFKSSKGLLTNMALTIPYYYSKSMQTWVDRQIDAYQIQHCIIYSSAMAQYVLGDKRESLYRVIDFVDVDSDKWLQYAKKKRWPANWIYQREAKLLLDYDKKIAQEFNASLFVSEKEANHFSALIPSLRNKIDYFNNGVDTTYFSSVYKSPSPYKKDEKVLVFTGAMDYWANVEAVEWFANDILPKIQKRLDKIKFYIVGSNPTESVLALTRHTGVEVTGRVEDVRPYVEHAAVAIAPLRIARGIQNKVLEAMAMGKTVVATSQAADGIAVETGKNIIINDSSSEWVTSIISLLSSMGGGNTESIGQSAEDFVKEKYIWAVNFNRLDNIMKKSPFLSIK
jgi:sugar transferase (PEP-CTERM/EpsH1 system associated)